MLFGLLGRLRRVMKAGVIADGSEFKVFRGVVGFVSVFVVRDLVLFQGTANLRLQHHVGSFHVPVLHGSVVSRVSEVGVSPCTHVNAALPTGVTAHGADRAAVFRFAGGRARFSACTSPKGLGALTALFDGLSASTCRMACLALS